MPDFRFDYQAIRSRETGLFIFRPIISATLKQLADPEINAMHGRFRVDTGADVSAVPFELAAAVLGLNGSPKREEILLQLDAAMRVQNLNPIKLATALGGGSIAYPLWVPIEIIDDDGNVGEFDGLITFVEGKKSGFLAGLCGFLDKFDLSFRTQDFEFGVRAGTEIA